MKRLHATALVAALAAAAPAWGDQPARSDQVLTLTNKDGKPHQYKVLKSYKHPSGGTAYDIQDEATGDVMTVIENATAEQIQPTLKPEVVTEVTPGAATKPGVATKPGAATKPDPILQPKAYVDDTKVQKKMDATPAPPAQPARQYTRPPVPAVKRWFGWMQKDAKPSAPPPAPKPTAAPSPAPGATIIEAAYHPDPMYRLIACLRDDLLPSMREVAADELASMGRSRPEAIDALVEAAGHDPAPSVRLCCVGHLGALRVQTPACRAVLHNLQRDRNEGVRAAAGVVLAHWQQQ